MKSRNHIGGGMLICGLSRLTLLDYPEHVGATIFTGGCNFRCPFCQNGDLVLDPASQERIPEEEILDFLKDRKGRLEGVCITGGEPTLQPDLESFICKIKEMGYLVKLDSNGYRPDVIKKLLNAGYLDYIAMDIKNSLTHYGETAGVGEMDDFAKKTISESIGLIMNSGIEYEFRTTVVKELHSEADFREIAEMLSGARAYYLQNYRESDAVIKKGFHGFTKEELEHFVSIIKPSVQKIGIRGVD